MDTANEPKYTSLTVPQLKALCKEKKITGYSKLGKSALIEKLIALGSQVPTARTTGTIAGLGSETPIESSFARPTSQVAVAKTSLICTESTSGEFPGLDETLTVKERVGNKQIGHLEQLTTSAPHAPLQDKAPKRGRESFEISSNTSKKKPRTDIAVARTPQRSSAPQIAKRHRDTSQPADLVPKPVRDADTRINPVQPSKAVSRPHRQAEKVQGRGLGRAPFKPLPIANGTKSTASNGSLNDFLQHLPLSVNPYDRAPVSPVFKLITLLPTSISIMEAQKWAIILSGLDDEERIACSLVSKAFRYAVYLSAVEILSRNFQGRRLATLLQQYPSTTMNFWPYLRDREREKKGHQTFYQESCSSRFFGEHIPVSQNLWASPDYENQAGIAMRFLLTRVWFAISVLGDGESCRKLLVTDAREVIKGEIWCVDMVSIDNDDGRKSSKESFYVLEETCEVVGRPAITDHDESTRSNQNLRVDWSDYVQSRLLPAGFHSSPPVPLRSHLKWTNAEEYDKGISKLWLKRIEKEGALGLYKRKLAERYVMACVVSNGVSGEWMSANRMQQEFAGGAMVHDHSARKQEKVRVNLFLPSHHLVESVHVMTAGGKNLHKELAVVQTPGREYFILRENGMEVGCEEDGVWDVWRNILSCDSRGIPS
ncbi:hypothetical protein SCHPADRAFT_875780 [Schizopora paradoxa]|uniref:Rho termination factor N-terminal domain-containing protein n=1 Tax=Schizopora paradoxa TaxID=27342 RepID=A0A0H2RK05_9AGAM|nr:hypothetical protein SCHPADRAFT_875780 [Schizopora paradoxa]